MDTYESLSHTKWECKHHVVFIPKCRKKVMYGQLRRELGPVFRELAERTECRIEEGHLMIDHVPMLISIPPKMSVAAAMGFIKGKSAIHIARVYAGRRRSFIGQHFWARGYWVSTVGKNEEAVRRYIREQEKEDLRLDQLEMKQPLALPELTRRPGPAPRLRSSCGLKLHHLPFRKGGNGEL